MKKKYLMLLAALAAAVIAAGLAVLEKKFFQKEPAASQDSAAENPLIPAEELARITPPPSLAADVDAVVRANTDFALACYSRLKVNDGNIFFSPFSVSAALAMAYEGARGKTAEEMRAVFRFPEDADSRRAQYAAILNGINRKDKPYALSVANALWAQVDYKFLKEYFEVADKYYGGEAANLDFVRRTESSRARINGWGEAKTSGKIRDLIPRGALNSLTRLVITNAVYFKGKWELAFDEKLTEKEPFRINKKNTVEAPLMRRSDAEFGYAENDALQLLEMPYSGDDLSMLLLLPKNDDMAALDDSFSAQNLSAWIRELRSRKVRVFIPGFKFDAKYFLAEDLKGLGMPAAFSEGAADFSGMDGTQYLFISQVIHQAFVEVNEEGTEAAAATAVTMALGAAPVQHSEPPIPVFRADHPFIFLIRDTRTGCILFLGRVSNPAQ